MNVWYDMPMGPTDPKSVAWDGYDTVAEYCARHGVNLKLTQSYDLPDPLPHKISKDCLDLINDDPDAFCERVRATAYEIAMSSRTHLTARDRHDIYAYALKLEHQLSALAWYNARSFEEEMKKKEPPKEDS